MCQNTRHPFTQMLLDLLQVDEAAVQTTVTELMDCLLREAPGEALPQN